ncbi:hypothetical protein HVZ34_17995 [Escherichia coli]|nr:hypothetical protein [Escherichia coli]MBA8213098.1 hypothetical protein [Escherichia coli]
MAAGHNLDVTASSVSAGHSALLSAGNDLSLNAVRESKNSRNGRSESHESHAAVSTVTAGAITSSLLPVVMLPVRLPVWLRKITWPSGADVT